MRGRIHAFGYARKAAIVLAAIAAGGCSSTEAVTTSSAVDLGCSDAYSETLPVGRIANNVWNRQAVGAQRAEQCVRARSLTESDAREYGWRWGLPPESSTLISFPQVVYGWKPWDGGETSHPRLPIRIADIGTLRLSYAMETSAEGKHNLATTLWLTRSGATGAEPNPKDISTDLMVWTDSSDLDPFGERVGYASIDGLDFEIWFARDMGDASGEGPRWNYVAYRATTQLAAASLDLKAFLQHAIEHEFVSPDHYVSDVEVGNEIMSGRGETWIKSISLEVERQKR